MLSKTVLRGTAALALGLTFAIASGAAEARERWKMHSAFAKNQPILGSGPINLAKSIEEMSDGEFDIRVFEPGALVPGIQYFDPVAEGAIDAAFSTPGFDVAKNEAFAFFAAVPFGPAGGEYLAWIRHGGGQELADEMYGAHGLKMFFCNIIAPESSGWFRKEIASVDDLKGLKMRFFGLGAKVMEKLGVSTQLLSPGDIYPALELGTIDATEFSFPAVDKALGFYQVAKFNYYPGWHQQSTLGHVVINQKKYDALSDAHKAMLKYGCEAQLLRSFAEAEAIQGPAMKYFEEKGVQVKQWSPDMIETFRTTWEEVAQEAVAESEDAKKIWESYTAFRDDYDIWREHGYLK